MPLSRREFVAWTGASGIALGLSRLALAEEPEFIARETLPGPLGLNPGIVGKGRIDGVAKVTGAKLYVSDFRAKDLPGWPADTSHALLVRSPDASHIYEGLDLDRLTADARPSAVVAAEDLVRAGTRVPAFYSGDLLCPAGSTPLYLGQPVALLIFATFDAYDRARVQFRDGSLIRFGAETGPLTRPNYGAWRFTRIAGATPDSPDVYAPIQEGWISPGFSDGGGRPIWRPLPVAEGGQYAKGATYGEEIRKELAANNPELLVVAGDFETQSIDPMFLEPECGLAWYDGGNRSLELILGVQSPYEAAEAVEYLLGEAAAEVKPDRINAQFAYVGGGFGGKDHTPFPLYVALAGLFFPDRPVRLAHDRYQQFQGGIKRHAFKMKTQIGVDRASGKIVAFAADHVLDGGGLANYSPSVAVVGATAALGIYDAPKVDVTTVALHSRAVTAGSMRGYGTLQTMTALEVLIDEAAMALPLDPIEFRRRNLLKTGGKSMTGTPFTVSVRTPELLDKLEQHAIWRDRVVEKSRVTAGTLVGTGVACVIKDYGTGADCSLGRIEVAADGSISVWADAVEMGNGIGTAIANRVALQLGGVGHTVAVAQIGMFDELGLVTSGDPYTMTQEAQDEAAKNPRWVPAISSATSASIGAHVGTQAVAQAAGIVFRFGLWPAALELWGIPKGDPRVYLWEEAYWQGDELIMSGLPPLPLSKVAAKAHEQKGVTGAMGHAFSRWAWSQASFPIGGFDWEIDLDALAVRYGGGPFQSLDRTSVAFPPTDYNRIGTAFVSGCGTAVRVEIEAATGAVRVAKAYSVVECGQALSTELVSGQAQGGFAMAVGQTLHEDLPLYEDGPGNGQWNLGDYVIPRASDLPIHDLEIEVLPPISPKEGPKGIAEVVMIPAVPALLNAIHDATGHRFNRLPVTPDMIRGVLS
ncbi:MAG TPA: molybdopterin cofactor-binding domain-containing protein [Bauldia sp.]|nr:molybdopterin cofactor-binding domain-containing protein [Bauldia sp.]